MKRAEISVLLAGVLLALIQFAGCAQKPLTFNRVEILTPKGPQTIAQGQSVPIQARVLNDLNAGGVSFTFATLPGFGTLNQTSTTSATFTAPNAVSSETVVKIIVRSLDFPKQFATVTVTVEPPPTITTTTLTNPTLNATYSATVTATGGLLPLSWAVTSGTLPPGLSLSSSTTNSVQITGKPTTVGSFTFTITVTDSAGFSSSQQFTVVVSSLAITTTSPLPPASTTAAYSVTFAATGGVAPLTWSVANGSILPPGLMLNSTTGVLSGTPTQGGTFTFGITVTDSANPAASATVNFTVVVSGAQNLAGLKGPYAFTFSGYNNTGFVTFAGTFTADGNGAITAGEEDFNSITGTPVTFTNLVGSYTLGADGRGTFTFTGSTPAQPTQQTYAFSIDATGSGRFIEFDSSSTRGSGRIHLQKVTTCVVSGTNTNTFAGSFAFGGAGFAGPAAAGSGPIAFAGAFTATPPISPSTVGSIAQGEMDTNVPNQTQSFNPGVSGLYQPGPDTTHCTMSLTSGNLGTQNFSAYPISVNDAFLVETDRVSATSPFLASGEMIQQAVAGGTFPTQNVLSQPIAGGLSGQFLSGGLYLPEVAVIQISAQGSGSVQFLIEDNQAGNLSNLHSPFTVSYNADSLGRVIPSLPNPYEPILYLVSSTEAFFVGTLNGGPTFGHFEGQSGSPFTAQVMANTFVEGTSAPAVSSDRDISGFLTLSDTAGVTGTQDLSTVAGNLSAQNVVGTYALTNTGLTDGSGVMTLTSPVFTGDFFIITPNKIVMITTTPGDVNPVLIFIEQ
jgi:large repetitive protein